MPAQFVGLEPLFIGAPSRGAGTRSSSIAVCSRTRAAFTPFAIREPAMTKRVSATILPALVAAIGLAAPAGVRGQQGANQPGTKWTEEQLRQAIELARVGRKLTPRSWPGGARVAVCLSFDTDTEAPLLRDG